MRVMHTCMCRHTGKDLSVHAVVLIRNGLQRGSFEVASWHGEERRGSEVCEARTGQRVGKSKGFLHRLCALSWKTRPASVDEPMTTKTITDCKPRQQKWQRCSNYRSGHGLGGRAYPPDTDVLHHFVSIFTWGFMSIRVMLILIWLQITCLFLEGRLDDVGSFCLHPLIKTRPAATPNCYARRPSESWAKSPRKPNLELSRREKHCKSHGCGWRLWV